jgi:hypothetical protein
MASGEFVIDQSGEPAERVWMVEEELPSWYGELK